MRLTIPLSPRYVPIPIGWLKFESYITTSPSLRLCSLTKVIVSFEISTPPPLDIVLPSNSISLVLFITIGFKTAPEPLPPEILT